MGGTVTRSTAAWLSGGRLHLQHGPIDLVIGAEGPGARAAFDAAIARFDGLLDGLVSELPLLRSPVGRRPALPVARRMHDATWPHRAVFLTPMAAVAGAVADEMLAALVSLGSLTRAYVNNGGDIALYLGPGTTFDIAMQGLDNRGHGQVRIAAGQGIGGVATSGTGGRSLSMGIADSVTVLASTAAAADAAATLIANAVDLPGHPAIRRCPAHDLDHDSDLKTQPVVTHVGSLSRTDITAALAHGLARAEGMRHASLIHAAALTLRGRTITCGLPALEPA